MKKKPRVYQENVKTRHTAHWDWDYLTWEQIEQRLKEAGVDEDKQIKQNGKLQKDRHSTYGIWIGLGLLIIAALVLAVIFR
jgi:uncharacterized membrane protein YukC